MPVRMAVRLDPIARDIALLIDQELSPDAQADRLRTAAQAALTEGQETNRAALGYVPEHDTFIDGSKRADLSAVRANSAITFEFQLLTDIIEWIDEQLILHSPVGKRAKSPEYARSHVWFADNVECDPLNPPPAEGYVVLNATPYARKIERGQSNQAPDGVYEAVATMAKRRFGNIAYVGFSYRSFPGGAVGKWAQTASAQALAKRIRKGNPRTRADWLTRQPAIFVDPGR